MPLHGFTISPASAGERSSVMRFKWDHRFRPGPAVATGVETVVAMAMTIVVTVFFVVMAVDPAVIQMQTA